VIAKQQRVAEQLGDRRMDSVTPSAICDALRGSHRHAKTHRTEPRIEHRKK